MASPLDARARRSQQALLQTGMELLNSNREATLSDIAAHAGVGRTTLYRQYSTRENLIAAIASHCLARLDKATASVEQDARSALDALRLIFECVMPLTQEMQFLIHLDQFETDVPAIKEINRAHSAEIEALITLAKQEGSIDTSLPTSWVANLVDGLFIVGWLQMEDGAASANEAASLAFRTFCKGTFQQRRKR